MIEKAFIATASDEDVVNRGIDRYWLIAPHNDNYLHLYYHANTISKVEDFKVLKEYGPLYDLKPGMLHIEYGDGTEPGLVELMETLSTLDLKAQIRVMKGSKMLVERFPLVSYPWCLYTAMVWETG